MEQIISTNSTSISVGVQEESFCDVLAQLGKTLWLDNSSGKWFLVTVVRPFKWVSLLFFTAKYKCKVYSRRLQNVWISLGSHTLRISLLWRMLFTSMMTISLEWSSPKSFYTTKIRTLAIPLTQKWRDCLKELLTSTKINLIWSIWPVDNFRHRNENLTMRKKPKFVFKQTLLKWSED